MWDFILSHLVEIFFGLVSVAALAFCRYCKSQLNNYKKLLDEQNKEDLESCIDTKLEPIYAEIHELRSQLIESEDFTNKRFNLMISSYRYNLICLCKGYLKQGYITPEQYDKLTEQYKVYAELGGNGQAKDYYDRTINLPIIEK